MMLEKPSAPAFPKPKDAPKGAGKEPLVVRLKGNAMKKFRFEVFMRDNKRCVICGCLVSFSGKDQVLPPMHLAHRRNKRMWGDTLENCITTCSSSHLIDLHNPKSVARKG